MFIVIEIQKDLEGHGTIVEPIPTFSGRLEAESCWHSKLASAAISSVPVHTVRVEDDDGNTIRTETYLHRPQPEPEEAPAEE